MIRIKRTVEAERDDYCRWWKRIQEEDKFREKIFFMPKIFVIAPSGILLTIIPLGKSSVASLAAAAAAGARAAAAAPEDDWAVGRVLA